MGYGTEENSHPPFSRKDWNATGTSRGGVGCPFLSRNPEAPVQSTPSHFCGPVLSVFMLTLCVDQILGPPVERLESVGANFLLLSSVLVGEPSQPKMAGGPRIGFSPPLQGTTTPD